MDIEFFLDALKYVHGLLRTRKYLAGNGNNFPVQDLDQPLRKHMKALALEELLFGES